MLPVRRCIIPILWGVPAPKKLANASVRLLCVKAGQERFVSILGPLIGLQTHWDGGRTVPCEGHACAHHEKPMTWKGFQPVIVSGYSPQGVIKGSYPWVLVVSEEIGDDAIGWKRGTVVKISRPGSKSNGPMRALVLDRPVPADLPEPFDVKPYVLRAMGFQSIKLAKPYGKAGAL